MKDNKRKIGLLLVIFLFSGTLSFAQKIKVETERGTIILQLDPDKAPVTARNFLAYVNQHIYDGAAFYRVVRMDNQEGKKVKIEVIQGGLGDDSTKALPPIRHESRNGPGSAAAEFFICINDQPELDFNGKRNPDGQGFAAFGKVISGMDVVRQIQKEETGQGEKVQTLKKPVKVITMSVLKKQ
jgi:peptidyl-prolyl cis-trans isomerase A (cyclophilin A)